MFLEHVINNEGIAIDVVKVETMTNWPRPTNVLEVRLFLGLTSYFMRFVGGFSNIAMPTKQLLQKNKKFMWDDKCEAHFTMLKTRLTIAPIFTLPFSTEDFVINSNAFSKRLSCV